MPTATQVWRPKIAPKAIPFVLGLAFAALLFTLFSLDLWHHWVPYRPHKPSSLDKLLPLLLPLAPLLAPIALRWLRERRTRSWPWTQSAIERASIRSYDQRQGTSYRLTVGYSYSVNGDKYGGVYVENFGSESEACGVLDSLKSFPPPVRYKPDDPFTSAMYPYRDAALAVRSDVQLT